MPVLEKTKSILRTLNRLPEDKIAEVHDFVLFLSQRYATQSVNQEIGDWSDEDIEQLCNAVEIYAEEACPWNGPV